PGRSGGLDGRSDGRTVATKTVSRFERSPDTRSFGSV
ncbi:MAG: hypothetical protein ACI8XM_001041, partial [Haloarculaceae archaeon]